MLKIYGTAPSRGLRVIWLAEEMGLAYEAFPVVPKTTDPAFLSLNPLGTFPVLIDGAERMIESVAMLIYLADRYGPTPLALAPENPGYGFYLQFLEFGEAALCAPLSTLVAAKYWAPERPMSNWLTQHAADSFKKRIDFLAAHLERERAHYVAGGRFTAADISVHYAVGLARYVGLEDMLPQRLRDYHARIAERAAFQRALGA